ncbi:GspH/FimT family pseudopilin [Halomonas sp.]|uniref:GspH/FimT family pseudopilin n=1 Tax=Halomonas sp. TaxID=1486246 RepID=UPI003D127C7C
MRRQRGFTLIELLVTVAVVVIVATIAVPNFRTLSARSQLVSDYNQILSGLYLARSEAIKRREEVVFNMPAQDGSSWGYSVYVDGDSENPLRSGSGRSASVSVSSDDTTYTFDPLGKLVSSDSDSGCDDTCTITLTHDALGEDDDRTITITRAGVVRQKGAS